MARFDETRGISSSFVLGQWVKLLFHALSHVGVRDVVISPGSRSTPLVWGALRAATMTCHSVIDERAAAFFALGLARCTGRVPLLVCTSGSAGAHYLPALIEARQAGIPLLALTADRPSELQDCGAPQTIPQIGLFGRFAPTIPLDEPSLEEDKARSLIGRVVAAGASAHGPHPGPIHLNFPVGKPLEPTAAANDEEVALEQVFGTFLAARPASVTAVRTTPARDALRDFAAQSLHSAERLIITAGPIPSPVATSVRRLAAHVGAPCLFEHAQAGPGVPLDLLVAHWENASGPPLPTHVVHFGPPCVSSAWGEFLKRAPFEHFVVPGPELLEPSRKATAVLLGDLGSVVEALEDVAPSQPMDPAYLRSFTEYQASLPERIRAAIAATSGPSLSEVEATAAVLRGAVAAHQLLLGNSLPLRIASWVGPFVDVPPPASRPRVVTARGANGIDGWIAGAAGAAMGTGRSTVALLGDVTAAHDLSSLALVARARVPLVVAILDNQGGRIFDHLPVRLRLSDTEFAYWTTRPDVRLDHAAAAFGVEYHLAESVEEIERILPELLEQPRGSVLHVRADASGTRDFLSAARGGDR